MLSIIEVTCPHCGAKGQLMMPPMGAIIVGPCPECQGIVAVFCGHVLPLDKEVIMHGTSEEKREHLMETLVGFLNSRVLELFEKSRERNEEFLTPHLGNEDPALDDRNVPNELSSEQSDAESLRREEADPQFSAADTSISDEELEVFVRTDLPLLDNKEYFRSVFS